MGADNHEMVSIYPFTGEDRERLTACLKELGQAAAHVRTFTTPAPPPSIATRMASAALEPPADRPRSGPGAARPSRDQPDGKQVQDEWGFFDPGQCGFSALAKLAQPATDRPIESGHTSVRVIPY